MPAELESESPVAWQAPDKSETPRALPSIAPAVGFPAGRQPGYSGLSSFCSRLCHHPVTGALQKFDGHRFASLVILHRDDDSLRRAPFSSSHEPHAIVELQRQRREKNRVFAAAKFNDRGLTQADTAPACGSHLHWNSKPSGLWEKPRQLLCAVLFIRCECQTA